MPWAAAIGAVGAIGGAYLSSQGANKAANTQAGAANAASEEQRRQYDQTRADQSPYRTAGYSALSRMSDLLGLSGNTSADGYGSLTKRFTGADVATDPGYQFGLKEGLDSAQGSAAAKGGLYSGATLKALTQYGNDYATTKFDDAYNRYNQDQSTLYNRLAGISGTGQTSTQQVDQAGQHMADQVGNNLVGAGNARGAADIATGNAIGNGLNQAGAWWLRSGNNGLNTGNSYIGSNGNQYANWEYGGQTGGVGD
jgi:hypothetical protein